jgi:hypothetical protein
MNYSLIEVMVNKEQLDIVDKSYSELRIIRDKLCEVQTLFSCKIDVQIENPLIKCLNILQKNIETVINKYSYSSLANNANDVEHVRFHETSKHYGACVDLLVKKLLFRIQEIYKCYHNVTDEVLESAVENPDEQETDDSEEQVNLKLQERLLEDINNFKIKEIVQCLEDLLHKLSNITDVDTKSYCQR